MGSFLAERGSDRDLTGAGRWVARLPVALALATVAGVLVTLYLMYTPVGSLQVYGLQGRYLVPLLALGAVTLCARHQPRATPWSPTPFVAGMALLGVAAMAKTAFFYYGTIGLLPR